MTTNIFANAAALSDDDLLARTRLLAATEREATAELLAHLAVLETRPSVYAALGYGSLFGYCTQALGLSEDAACTRIAVTRWCRQFPPVVDLMACGALTLTTVRLLGPHLTVENHESVLSRAANRCRADIEALVAELNPQPDVPATVRKLPAPKGAEAPSMPSTTAAPLFPTVSEAAVAIPVGIEWSSKNPTEGIPPTTAGGPAVGGIVAGSPVSVARVQRPVVRASAPERYRVQFTIGQESHDKLRRVQALLRREIPSGDTGVIFARALGVLLEKVEKAKLGAHTPARRAIRPETDKPRNPAERSSGGTTHEGREPRAASRHVPANVRAAVWSRDAGQCAFVALGTRCTERSYLEFHHVLPFARQGPAIAANISLRCRRHNQYEAELDFGPWVGSRAHAREEPEA